MAHLDHLAQPSRYNEGQEVLMSEAVEQLSGLIEQATHLGERYNYWPEVLSWEAKRARKRKPLVPKLRDLEDIRTRTGPFTTPHITQLVDLAKAEASEGEVGTGVRRVAILGTALATGLVAVTEGQSGRVLAGTPRWEYAWPSTPSSQLGGGTVPATLLMVALALAVGFLLPTAARTQFQPADPRAMGQLPSDRRQAPYPPAEQDLPPLVLRKYGIFWAGGEIVQRTQSGTQCIAGSNVPYADQEYLVGQAYVEYFIPQNLRRGADTIPIVLITGVGLVGVHYLTTPDGREGWAHYFLRRGFPVYIVDPPGRGRAGFLPDPFNHVRAGAAPPSSQPFLSATDSAAWLEWNTGPEPRVHGRFDPSCIGNDNRGDPPAYCNGNRMSAVDEDAYKHWLGALMPAGPLPAGVEPGYLAVLQTVGPAIYIGHSMGGSVGGTRSDDHPELFRAYVGIEPAASTGSCAAAATTELNGLQQLPVLTVHGINQVGRPDGPDCVRTYERINAAGGDATYFNLPQMGIWGNDHIMMWNDNSDELAGLLYEWIEQHVER